MVIIPCFNDGPYLARAIGSVLQADVLPQKIILVDDCSTDPLTQHIVQALQTAPCVQVIGMDKNRGAGAARNQAFIHISSAQYVLNLDADDCIESSILTEALHFLDTHSNYAGVGGYVKKYFYDPPDKHTILHTGYWKTKGGGIAAFLFTNVMTGTILMRAKAWQDVEGYDESITHEDLEFYLRLTDKGWRIHSLRKTFLHYYASLHDGRKKRVLAPQESMQHIYKKNRPIYRKHFYKGLGYLVYLIFTQLTFLKALPLFHMAGKDSVGLKKILYYSLCVVHYLVNFAWRSYFFLRKKCRI